MSKDPTVEELEGLADILTLDEAAHAVHLSDDTLRRAIREGELKAFIPRGRKPSKAGRGMGYRIFRRELKRWYFGEAEDGAG